MFLVFTKTTVPKEGKCHVIEAIFMNLRIILFFFFGVTLKNYYDSCFLNKISGLRGDVYHFFSAIICLYFRSWPFENACSKFCWFEIPRANLKNDKYYRGAENIYLINITEPFLRTAFPVKLSLYSITQT